MKAYGRVERKHRIGLLIAALKSGDFKQGRGALREVDKFCCLGVACEVYRRENPQAKRTWHTNGSSIRSLFLQQTITLPLEVIEWYGFDESDPMITVGSEDGHASDLNDSGCTFDQIARGFEGMIE